MTFSINNTFCISFFWPNYSIKKRRAGPFSPFSKDRVLILSTHYSENSFLKSKAISISTLFSLSFPNLILFFQSFFEFDFLQQPYYEVNAKISSSYLSISLKSSNSIQIIFYYLCSFLLRDHTSSQGSSYKYQNRNCQIQMVFSECSYL